MGGRRGRSLPGSGGSRGDEAGALLLDRSDVRRMLTELAETLAPADLRAMVGRARQLRSAARSLDPHRFGTCRDQVLLAVECLRDHVAGRCPQIPYRTISLLAAGLHYFDDRLDIIPDFLPRIGRLDDAVVMAVAFEMAAPGVRRYGAWKGSDVRLLLPAPRA